MKDKGQPFFVGYLALPAGLRGFLLFALVFLISFAAGSAYWISTTQDDPGPGAFRFDYGRQTVSGVIELTPLPILHVTEGNDRIPVGHTLMLSGPGKNGVQARPSAKQGQQVTVTGIILERGDLDMMQVQGGNRGMRAIDGENPIPETEDLGRWKLSGEICDGKCLAGAMRPGRGIAHKACASLCLLGKVPPVFVSTQQVEGSEFFMISGPEGAEMPEDAYSHIAQFISVEGRITRHGSVMVFALEPDTVEVLP